MTEHLIGKRKRSAEFGGLPVTPREKPQELGAQRPGKELTSQTLAKSESVPNTPQLVDQTTTPSHMSTEESNLEDTSSSSSDGISESSSGSSSIGDNEDPEVSSKDDLRANSCVAVGQTSASYIQTGMGTRDRKAQTSDSKAKLFSNACSTETGSLRVARSRRIEPQRQDSKRFSSENSSNQSSPQGAAQRKRRKFGIGGRRRRQKAQWSTTSDTSKSIDDAESDYLKFRVQKVPAGLGNSLKVASATLEGYSPESTISASISDHSSNAESDELSPHPSYQRQKLASSLSPSLSDSPSDASFDSSSTIINLLPPKPQFNQQNPSNLSQRLASFLPQLQHANAILPTDGAQQLDNVDDRTERYIEMDLGLGVLEGEKSPRKSVDGVQIEGSSDSSDSSSDDSDAKQRSQPRGAMDVLMGKKSARGDSKFIEETID